MDELVFDAVDGDFHIYWQLPYETEDFSSGIQANMHVADLANNTQLGYKYFDFRNVQRISVTYHGAGEGILEVRTQENGNSIGTIPIQPSLQWTQASGTVNLNGVHALYLQFRGKGRIDLKTVTFSEEDT